MITQTINHFKTKSNDCCIRLQAGGLFFMPNNEEMHAELLRISHFNMIDDKKVYFQYQLKNGQSMQIVIKESEVHNRKILFAVFFKRTNEWKCEEIGYHSDIEAIERYLYFKYLSKLNLEQTC